MRVRTFEIVLACGLAFFTYAATRASAQDAQGQSKAQAHSTPKGSASETSKTSSDNDAGEKAFQTHCSRCHNAPEDLSPRVVPAVVRQMRVRAMLSAEDERALVKFFAP
jgi:mono/diheme cytochrome c family protein